MYHTTNEVSEPSPYEPTRFADKDSFQTRECEI